MEVFALRQRRGRCDACEQVCSLLRGAGAGESRSLCALRDARQGRQRRDFGAGGSQACSNHREVLCTYFGDTKKLFKRLDTDGNGQLSWEEFKQGAREEAEPVAVVESQEPLYGEGGGEGGGGEGGGDGGGEGGGEGVGARVEATRRRCQR